MKTDQYSPLKVLHHHDRLELLRWGDQPAPTQVQLVISDLCNHDCEFCAFRMSGYTSNELFKVVEPDGTVNNNPRRMIPLEKVLEILDDCEAMGVRAVQITGGGEPTVHPQHEQIFQAVLDRGLELAVVTNGARMSSSLPRVLANAAWVRFSLDAAKPDTYSRVHGTSPETFYRVLMNIRQVCDARSAAMQRTTVGVSYVVTRLNAGEIVDAAMAARSLGVDNFRVSAMFNPDGTLYYPEALTARIRESCEAASKLSTGTFRFINCFDDRYDDLAQGRPDYQRCGYQHFNTYIAGDLNVYRCCVTAYNPRGLVGSLQQQRFRELWESQAKRDSYEHFDARGCERCMFNAKNRVIDYALQPSPQDVNFV